MTGPRLAYSRPGPTLRGVTLLRLPTLHNGVWMPEPTCEHGGVPCYPRGTVLRIDIGNADRCLDTTARHIVGALAACKGIEVVGTNPYGVAETTAELGQALAGATSRSAATC